LRSLGTGGEAAALDARREHLAGIWAGKMSNNELILGQMRTDRLFVHTAATSSMTGPTALP
jgi:hypothetical protein